MFRRLSAIALFACLAIVCLAGAAFAADDHHALVQLRLDRQPGAEEFLRANTGSLDIVFHKPGVEAHIAAQPAELELLRQAGYKVTVLQADMEAASVYPDKGVGFGLYHTLSESVAFVDSLRMLHPNIIGEKFSIGQTHQSRDIWAFKVSDNPDVDEDEPEILIEAMHHAREIMAGEFVIMFAEYLAQNYGVDPEITWLVDNRELYLIPMMNPDGVYYNESIAPDGGGMWRKNRRYIDISTYGVDINRNYPYQWAYDDYGSSPTPSSDTYRGPSAGSEPETQALMNFFATHDIRTHDSIHTYSNLLLYPWGYIGTPTADGAAFEAMAAEMVKFNGYAAGQPGNILYDVNGGTFDWTYGVQGVFSFSTEIGSSSDGFWPSEARRQPLFQENIWPHIYLMRVAGAFVTAQDAVVNAAAKAVQPGDSGELSFTVVNQSPIAASAAVSVTVSTDDPWIQLLEAQRAVGALAPLGEIDLAADPIPFTVDPACPDGHLVQLSVTVHMPEGDLVTPLSFVVGSPAYLLDEGFEAGAGQWVLGGSWALTTSAAHSGSYSLTDTPAGNYVDNSLTYATLSGVWGASSLSFWHRFDIEDGWDYGRVEISVDGGAWTSAASYTGTQTSWSQVQIDLSAYAGSEIAIRFAMDTDYSITRDGWYIDDVVLVGASGSGFAMVTPSPIAPLASAVTGAQPELVVANAANPGGGATVYGFRVYSDALCTVLAASTDGVTEGAGQTAWTVPAPLATGEYWWRAWAGDGTDRTGLSQPESFMVNVTSDVPLGGALGLRVLGSVSGSGARFELSTPHAASVQVDIHDARGALVRRLYSGSVAGGARVLTWDGRDGAGRNAASGVYFVRARVGSENLTGRVVVVR